MGLDNGILVTGIKKSDIPSFVKLPLPLDSWEQEIEIAYWRKCWGIRSAILDTLHGSSQGYTQIDVEDIPAIIKHLLPFCSKEYWDANADSIWEFEEAIDFTLIQQIINLKWLYSYMLEHPEVKCRFYDSF